jgi:hypothetical protein
MSELIGLYVAWEGSVLVIGGAVLMVLWQFLKQD